MTTLTTNHNKMNNKPFKLIPLTCLIALGLVQFCCIECNQQPTKDIDWSELELGMSNQAQKQQQQQQLSSQLANNLRILVSPQRRMTKSYEFEYANNSQPLSGQPESTYLIPSSNGQYSTSAGSSGNQVAGSAGHSAAYNALSASLASLKSRLNSRTVSLSSPDASTSSAGSASPYAAIDPSQQTVISGQSMGLQQAISGPAPYLSSHQDNQGSLASNQSNENKTIVLAIPAKINFLSDNRSSSSYGYNTKPYQFNPISQQLTLIQPSSDNQYYTATKSIEDPSLQAVPAIQDQQPQKQVQQQQQYMIVNQGSDQTNPLVAGGTLSLGQGTAIYQAAPQTVQQSPTQYASNVKYLQPISYQPIQAQAPVQSPVTQITYESSPSVVDQPQTSAISGTRYISCPDTCNLADPRWRKYSNSRYRACCSRSAQYESPVDSPSVSKVSEAGSKYADDSYYQYLYRKTRSRRAKKPSSRSRYNRYSAAYATSPGQAQEEEASRYESPYMSKQYRIRPDDASTGKASKEGRQHRRARNRDFESSAAQPIGPSSLAADEQGDEEEQPRPAYPSSDGSSASRAYPSSGSYSSQAGEELDEPAVSTRGGSASPAGLNYEDTPEIDGTGASKGNLDSPDYPVDSSIAEAGQEDSGAEGSAESPRSSSSSALSSADAYNYRRSKKQLSGPKSRAMRNKQSMIATTNKYAKSRGNNQRKKMNKQYNAQKLDTQSGRANASDYESTQPGAELSNGRLNESEGASMDEESQQMNAGNKEQQQVSNENNNNYNSSNNDNNSDKADQLYLANKYKTNLNDSTVASLSKTTMHLKEILSILEKKAQLKAANESSQTTTPSPVPSTTYNPLASLFESPYNSPSAAALSSALASEYLSSSPDLSSLKSPYRYETSALESASLRGSSLAAAAAAAAAASLPSSPYSSMYSSDPYAATSALAHYPPKYPLSSNRNLGPISVNHPRKRRVVAKNHIRYNNLMYPTGSVGSGALGSGSGLGGALGSGLNGPGVQSDSGRGVSPSSLRDVRDHHNHHHLRDHHHSLLHATAASAVNKHPLLKASSLYSSLTYPYWYTRTASPSVTNFYPYKNVNKVPYSPLLYSLG